jgi:deoxyribodipyrimidine photo-lyase
MNNVSIHWFKNDLRLHDNPALAEAAQADGLIGVYCVDARHDANSEYGPPKLGPHRRAFLRASLERLSARMAELGSRLLIVAGEPEAVIPALVRSVNARAVYTADEFAPEEVAGLRALQSALGDTPLHRREGGGLLHTEQLPFAPDEVPGVYTAFRKRVEAKAEIGTPLSVPTHLPPAPELKRVMLQDGLLALGDAPAGEPLFAGGEKAGLARVQAYIWSSECIARYKETRNGLLGRDFSSKFSPWLANGCLSPRRIHAEVRAFEDQVTANQSTYWLIFELLWREFFRWTLHAHGARLFARAGLLDRQDRPTARDAQVLKAWRTGRTGMPFIDANMRELAATGYMSNRGRQNVASFFARDLQQDWRYGAAWFEAQLVDYDVASNWGNWATVAGVGTDKRDNGFNVLAQAQRYDGDAEYISHWLPELRGLPAGQRHTAFLLDDATLDAIDYPRLIIPPPDAWGGCFPNS